MNRGARSTWIAVGALYAGLTLLYAWPLLPALGSRLPSDIGDPGLNTWILWWNAQAVPLTARWWNAPIFFPIQGAFALSETFLGLAPLTTPMQWMGASPVVAYNVAFLLSFFSAALAAHALAHELTGNHGAAVIAGIAFGFSPYRAAQLPHLQTLMSCWLPLGLVALHRFVATHRARSLVLLACCWLLNGLTTGYFLLFFSVLLTCWTAWFVRTWRDAAAIAAAVMIGSLPLIPLLVGYGRHQATLRLSRNMTEIMFYSADVSAIWAASPFVWLPRHWTLTPQPEGELYPGVVILTLTVAGVVAAWRSVRPSEGAIIEGAGRRRLRLALLAVGTLVSGLALMSGVFGGWRFDAVGLSVSTSHPYKAVTSALWLFVGAALVHPRFAELYRRRSALFFYVLAAIVMFVLALGPLGRVFGERFLYEAPYAWLMQLPGGHALRVPARFATLVILCLTQAASLSFVRFTRGRASAGVVVTVAIAVALDGWVPKIKTDPLPSPINLAGIDASLPVLELPMQSLYTDTAAMLRATSHGHPLVNGYSGYTPPHYLPLQQGLQDLDVSVFAALQQLGPVGVFVDRSRDAGNRYRELMARLSQSTMVGDTPAGSLFTIPARAPDWPPAGDRALPITAMTVTGGSGEAGVLTDGDLSTSWHSRDDDIAEPSVQIRFDRPATLSRLEMDLGPVVDYPRRLRVSVLDDGSSPAVVWDGGAAGPAITAALRDGLRVPLTVFLPAGTRAQQVLVTIVSPRVKASWSIAEIRAFGR